MDFNVLISAAQGHLRTRNMSVADMKIYTKRNKEKGRERETETEGETETQTQTDRQKTIKEERQANGQILDEKA